MTSDDEVAHLVRLAGPAGVTDAIAAERVARVRTAVHDAWREESVARQARHAKSRRRVRVAMLLATAAAVVIALTMWLPFWMPAPAPAQVARIDHATGSTAVKAGGAVISESTLATTAGTLAVTLTSGVHIRLDASSTIRLDSATDVTLEHGAVYVDSGGASQISIHTPVGVVRDIGTQFEVRLAGASLRVRVREGQVRVTSANGVNERAGAAEELFSMPDGSIGRRPISATGREWAWAERAAPPFVMEGKTLGAFLDWVAREGAWTVTFADRSFSAAARAIVLHGKPDLKGLTPAETLQIVLPTCGLRHHINANRVVIEREISKGPSR